ncbi:2OG-Fe(II) oxygenase [Burkholderia stagnalis]
MHDVTRFLSAEAAPPAWSPRLVEHPFDGPMPAGIMTGVFLFERVLSESACRCLVSQMDAQTLYPVGISGYSDPNAAGGAGSFRAMGWSPELASGIGRPLARLPRSIRNRRGALQWDAHAVESPLAAEDGLDYRLLGSTPWLRFMKYADGGMHVPHYDASFHQPGQRYRTLFSWVLYLTDAGPDQGGRLRFVDDSERLPRSLADWTDMARDDVILESVVPRAGRLLVFPHWLCHEVERFRGNDVNPWRYIVRGDVAYGY